MKKIFSIFLIMALILSLPAPVFAADDSKKTELWYTIHKYEPTFTVSIPGTLNLIWGDNYLPITVEGLDEGELDEMDLVIVYLADMGTHLGSSRYDDWIESFRLRSKSPSNNRSVFYQLYDQYGYQIDHYYGPDDVDELAYGKTLAAFVDNGTENINIALGGVPFESQTPGVYEGWITFGIKLASSPW